MILSRRSVLLAAGGAVICTGLVLFPATRAQSEVPLISLFQLTDVHGLTVECGDSSRLLIASHHGLHPRNFETSLTVGISDHRDDLMGFVANPADPERVFAATQLGELLASEDGGRNCPLLGTE